MEKIINKILSDCGIECTAQRIKNLTPIILDTRLSDFGKAQEIYLTLGFDSFTPNQDRLIRSIKYQLGN